MSHLQQNSAERIKETVARRASQAGPRNECFSVAEGMPLHVLFPTSTAASFALELSVERFHRAPLRLELVSETFYGLRSDLGIKRYEAAHAVNVA
jgi:hypothetical protein